MTRQEAQDVVEAVARLVDMRIVQLESEKEAATVTLKTIIAVRIDEAEVIAKLIRGLK